MVSDPATSLAAALRDIDWDEVARRSEGHERQADWRERSLIPLRKARLHRLKDLEDRKSAIAAAMSAYRRADPAGQLTVVLRGEFVRLDPPRPPRSLATREALSGEERRQADSDEVTSRPPLTRLVHRDSNSLALYLAAIYMAHLEGAPGKVAKNGHRSIFKEGLRASWADLAGVGGPSTERARRSRLRRALDGLELAGLVSMDNKGTLGRYERWQLLNDDGSGARYKMPGATAERIVPLPSAFFRNGWHLVLTPPEIAMLISIMEFAPHLDVVADGKDQGLPGVSFPETVKWGRYGISGEVYEAAHMLHEFDLVDFSDPMPNRRRGKLPDRRSSSGGNPNLERVPYHFYPPRPDTFDKKAYDVITERLELFDTPYRLLDNIELSSPADMAELLRKSKRER